MFFIIKVDDHKLPDKATKSPTSRPCCLKLEIRVSREEFGAGMKLLAPLKLAFSESLLPSNTSHPGPPLYLDKQIKIVTFTKNICNCKKRICDSNMKKKQNSNWSCAGYIYPWGKFQIDLLHQILGLLKESKIKYNSSCIHSGSIKE